MSSVLDEYAVKSPTDKGYTPGRLLFCADCLNFTKHLVMMDDDDTKVIACRHCNNIQAKMVNVMTSEWLDERYEQNPMLVSLMLVGNATTAKALVLANTPDEEPKKKLRSRLKEKAIAKRKVKVVKASRPKLPVVPEVTKAEKETAAREILFRGMRRPRKSVRVRSKYHRWPSKASKRRRWPKLLAGTIAGLAVLQIWLTWLAINYRIFIWPFTYGWDAFEWLGLAPDMIVQTGMVVSIVAIGFSLLTAVLWRRRRV